MVKKGKQIIDYLNLERILIWQLEYNLFFSLVSSIYTDGIF